MTSGAMARRRPASSAESSVRLPHAVKACTSQRDVASTQAVGTASRMGQLVTNTLRRARRRRDEGLGARSILAVVTEGSLTCPPWRSHLEVDLQSETRPRLAVAQMMHSVGGFIFTMSRVYEHTGVVWSVTSAAVHLQRYIRVIRCISVCICRALRCIISFRVFFGRPMPRRVHKAAIITSKFNSDARSPEG